MDYKFTFEDGSEAIYHSDLYHGDHKYIRKFMENGKWVYEYAADKAKNVAKKAASGAKWLGEAVKNDLNGLTDKAAKDLHRAQLDAKRNEDSYDDYRQLTKYYRHEAEALEKIAREKESNHEPADVYRKEASGARRAAALGSRFSEGEKNLVNRANQKVAAAQYAYDNTPSLKRKISELLSGKKKKKKK